jgi:hypothetical protein
MTDQPFTKQEREGTKMSKKKGKAQTLFFQATHSRNTHDWNVDYASNGRVVLSAKHKGVKYRIGILVTFLANHPGSNREDMTRHLQTFDQSYQEADCRQPLRQMFRAGIVTSNGKGVNASYSLTPKGKAIWQNVHKVFI